MKILIWSQYFWPESFHINAVAESLREHGMALTVLTGKPNYPEGRIFAGYRAAGIAREQHAGIDVVRVPIAPRGRASAVV